MRKNLPVSDNEYILSENDVLISRTDLKGDITYANPSFIKACGFADDELIGQHHNIVRHPDMPSEAFKNLWETVKSGKSWNGIVKNRRKDGGFYWVRANVTPHLSSGAITGYTSVRVKTTEQEKELAELAYSAIRQQAKNPYFLVNGKLSTKGLIASLRRINPHSIKFNLSLIFLAGASGHIANFYASQFMGLGDSGWINGGIAALSMVLMGGISLNLFKKIMKPINDASDFAASISAGNTKVKMPATPKNEFENLFFFFGTIQRSMISISDDVKAHMAIVTNSTAEIIEGNNNLEKRTEVQASSVQQAAASMEEINTAVQQNASNAMEAQKMADKSSYSVIESCQAIKNVVDTMKQIADTSEKMTEILNVIDNIAFQTNILALNASVEAARAGEHGRGFAVVASEVRSLASRSAESAKQVRALISVSSETIRNGYELVSDAESQVHELSRSVEHLSSIMCEITNASQEQSIGISQINDGICQIDLLTNENANLVRDAAKSVLQLDDSIVKALRSVEVFD